MVALHQSQPVKSLNKCSGGKRFVFKNFEQRISEIRIDVYRSLDQLKAEPPEGSSFFKESLVYWRELNTAEDFISFYEEMLPWVQTLPQVLLYKETIVSKLIFRLRMEAKLSLEAILRLIAALSRDLLEDFLPFLQRIADALVDLLKNGGDRDPEVIEQVFISWSYLMMHLQKYLMRDVSYILSITARMRYYPKVYVQNFMAEAISFLLRNASTVQLKKGVRKIVCEAVKKPSPARKYAVSVLLWYIMKGTSSRFHSRAKEVLRLLMDRYIMFCCGDDTHCSVTVVEVIAVALERAFQELSADELKLVLDCLLEQIYDCIQNKGLLLLTCLLSLLAVPLKVDRGKGISDYKKIMELVKLLVQEFILIPSTVEEDNSEFLDQVMKLMLYILDVPYISKELSLLSDITQQWGPVFMLRNSCILTFMEGLLLKDTQVLYALSNLMLSAMNNLIEVSPEETIYVMIKLFEKLQGRASSISIVGSFGISEGKAPRVRNFFREVLSEWVRKVKNLAVEEASFSLPELGVVWGVLCCFPYIFGPEADVSLIVDLVNALDQLPMVVTKSIAGLDVRIWQSLVGAALFSYQKCLLYKNEELSEINYFLSHAKRYKSSQHVLFAVAEILDSAFGSRDEAQTSLKLYDMEREGNNHEDSLHIFAENLGAPNKELRVSTLRMLCHVQKKLKADSSEPSNEEPQCGNVIMLLHSVETTPISVFTSREADILLSKIEVSLSSGRVSEDYIPLLLYGVIGLFYNRFAPLWEPALKCLTSLLRNYAGCVWDTFVYYLDKCHLEVFAFSDQIDSFDSGCADNLYDLSKSFKSFLTPDSDPTPTSTVVTLLLQSLQRESIPSVVGSHSLQLIPLFFKWLGYRGDETLSVGVFNQDACKGKEWRLILKEWLNLLKLMKNPQSLYQSEALKEVLMNRLLDDPDPDLQQKVLDCLLTWKDDFLVPYDKNLRSLITSKHLREELTTWSLSRESPHIQEELDPPKKRRKIQEERDSQKKRKNVQEEHRRHLIPLVIQLLIPKVRNLKTLASRKHAGVHHRRAVLCFLAELDINELRYFFSLLLKPLNPVAYETEYLKKSWSSCEEFATEFIESNFLRKFTVESVNTLSWKKRSGFLHVTEDILRTFDGPHVRPFLSLLMLYVVRVLESSSLSLDGRMDSMPSHVEDGSNSDISKVDSIGMTENALKKNMDIKQLKELRSLCLKVISYSLNKYESHDYGTLFWDTFFASIKPLTGGFKQQGSSSEKPSSLFSCFLAMSRSPALVSHLGREEGLVSSIFSILSVETASDAILSSVLNFIENLLNLDNDLADNEHTGIKRVLLPNVETLILGLHCLFTCQKGSQRKSFSWPGKTELRILLLLSKHISRSSDAHYFVDILLQFLAKKSLSKDDCVEGLRVILGMLPVLDAEATGKILSALQPLFLSPEGEVRLCLCDMLDGLALKDSSLAFLAKLVRNLNAFSVEEVGEIDYDARLNAYEEITPQLFFMLGKDSSLVVLSHCVYDMSCQELIWRQSALKSLISFIKFSAMFLDLGETCHQELFSSDDKWGNMEHKADVGWTKAAVSSVVNKFFLRHMGEAMTKDVSVQKEWIMLFKDMILNLPTVPTLNSFKPLCSDDAEVDFFNNILHLQTHRQVKALSRFRNVVSGGNLFEKVTMKVFVPLFFNMLFGVKDGKGEHLRDACLESLASVASFIQWGTYYSLLMRCFHEMSLKPKNQKLFLRLICSVLDKFHFFETSSHRDSEPSSEFNDMLPNSAVPVEIQATIEKSILPEVQKLLISDSERVNVKISLAALKLLKLLPVDKMDSQLPSIVQRISNFLKNRSEKIREEAMSALTECAMELGPAYLHFIVKVLKSTLKRGYELHVLGYTLNFMLSKTTADFFQGKLDNCLEDLLAIAENDILGDVSEEKEVEKFASKMKETRKNKSFDTLKLIAQSITFKTHALKLLAPIKSCLEKHLTQKVYSKVEGMLHQIALGIECNPSVEATDLFIFVHGLVENGISDENSRSYHLITVFALGVLNNRLKNMKLDKKDEHLLAMLDPLVGVLGNCLNSKYEGVVATALKCFPPLIRLPLPSLKEQAKQMKNFLLDFTQKNGSSSNPLMPICLRLLTVLLQSDWISLSNHQLKDLIQFLSVEIESTSASVVLSLLKAVVGRTVVVNEIYDLVKRVQDLMVRSQSDPIQKKCSQILSQFLLHYPKHEKRLQQHLDFLLKNLSYVHPSGREYVLVTVRAVLREPILDIHADRIFLKLIERLANENDGKLRSVIADTIKLLIERINQQGLCLIIDSSLAWYINEKPKSWSIGAEALGLLVEVRKKEFLNHIDEILPVAERVLTSAIGIAATKKLKLVDEAKIPLWREAYYTFVMLEKVLLQFQELYFQKDLEEIWQLVSRFLLHPHFQLQNISNRLLAKYFMEVSKVIHPESGNLYCGSISLMGLGELFSIAVSYCRQLKSQLTEEVSLGPISQNLVCSLSYIYSLSRHRKERTGSEFWSTLSLHEQEKFLQGFESLQSRRAKDLFFLHVSEDPNGQESGEIQSLLMVPLLKRLGKLALQREDIQMRIIFSCFRAVASHIGSEGCDNYAAQLLQPLYKVCEGYAGKLISDEMKQMAEEARGSIQRIMGTDRFVQAYNEIRKSLKAKRDRRKQELKRMAVINPTRHAKRKLAVAEKHRAHKKRKIMAMREGRRTGKQGQRKEATEGRRGKRRKGL